MVLKKSFDKLKSILGLSLSLAKSYFKTRNEGSYLGIFWYLLNPLAFFVIIMIMNEIIYTKPIQFYPLYLFMGLIMFNFFLNSTISSAKVMANNRGFLKTIKINKESLVIAVILEFIFAHIFEVLIFGLFMLYFKVSLAALIFYPLIFAFFVLFTLGISFVLATIGAYVVDLGNLWDVFVRLLWFLTPVFYLAQDGTLLYKLNLINPVFYFLSIARDAVIYTKTPPIWMISLAIFFSLLSFIIGIIIFNKNKDYFAERL